MNQPTEAASLAGDALAGFAANGPEALPVALLALDPALVRAVQAALGRHGLLDPPADGFLGPISQWALAAFCRARRLTFDGALTREAAAALLGPAPPPLRGEGLAGRVVAALQRQEHWLCRHPEARTIVYVEGLDLEGRRIPRRPDAFDDVRLVLRVTPDGRTELLGAWEATVAPGRPAVEEPAEPAGAPSLVRGQHKVWVIGHTAVGTDLEQEALVQVEPLPVTRDGNRDFRRVGDARQRGLFIIDQHGGRDAPRECVGGYGAGCLVGRMQDGHREFMALLRDDARFRVNRAYRFMTSLLRAEDLVT